MARTLTGLNRSRKSSIRSNQAEAPEAMAFRRSLLQTSLSQLDEL